MSFAQTDLKIDLTYLAPLLAVQDLQAYSEPLQKAQQQLLGGSGLGAAYRGWLHLPEETITARNITAIQRLKEIAKQISASAEVLLVVGIGGSYLGSRAALEYLHSPYYNHRLRPQIFYLGNSLSAAQYKQVLSIVAERDFVVNVISKSGSTVEPAIVFHLLKQLLEERYGAQGAAERIIATTDPASGTLRTSARQKGYRTFDIPPSVGGRYSVLTAVGLLPLAVAAVDIAELLQGAADMARHLHTAAHLHDNPAWQYVAARHALAARGRTIEMFGSYQPAVRQFAEWWRQLFGESEGKEGKGIFPATLDLTADLHSMGQYLQQGPRTVFSTILEIEHSEDEVTLHAPEGDALHYLDGQSLNELNRLVQQAACAAQAEGGAPSIIIRTPQATPYHLGSLFYFFEYACALSGYLLGVNPFNQPGVEAYKQELQRLIGQKRGLKLPCQF